MIRVVPDFYNRFHCLAQNCPDTCCKGWQVAIDAKTLKFYQSLEGAFGKKVQNAIKQENGEAFFCGEGDCCPMLDHGLCSIQSSLGEQALCTTCKTHPRFTEIYGATEECSLSLSCPEGARLLLEKQEPLTWNTQTDTRPVLEYNELDPDLYLSLERARSYAIQLLQETSVPLWQRIGFLFLFVQAFQNIIMTVTPSEVEKLIEKHQSAAFQSRQKARLCRLHQKKCEVKKLQAILKKCEFLTDEFPKLLKSSTKENISKSVDTWQTQFENLLVYNLFRFFKKAVNDKDVYTKVCMSVLHLCTAEMLWNGEGLENLMHVCSLYEKEITHSEENKLLIHNAFRRGNLTWIDMMPFF